MLLFLKVIGRFLAWAPEWVAKGLCYALGIFAYYCLPSRRRLVLSNLSHAFPGKDMRTLKRIGRTSCKRTMEMGVFSLASPFFSKARVRKHFSVVADLKALELDEKSPSRPRVVLVPHFCEMEAITMLPAIWDITTPETGVIYRPFKNKDLEAYVKSTRERFGLKLLSRKEGFLQAGEILRNHGCVAVLFDQNAGHHGVLSTFMDRIASTSELAGLLVQKYKADLLVAHAKRTEFWRAELHLERIPCEHNKDQVTLTANRWLEETLREDIHASSQNQKPMTRMPSNTLGSWAPQSEAVLDAGGLGGGSWKRKPIEGIGASRESRARGPQRQKWGAQDPREEWLWMHSRWRTQDEPKVRFRLQMRKSILPETLAFYNKEKLEPTYRLWVRLPNWLGDVVMALPLLRALKEARPDVELTLIGQTPVLKLLEQLGIGHQYVPLPKRGFGYFYKFLSLRKALPDTHLLFTNSTRGDIEARILGAPQRFGMRRPGKKRPLLTHCWDILASVDEREVHQTRVWEMYLQHFGLQESLDLTPFNIAADEVTQKQSSIGIIAGTENSPEKRWPVSHWNTLLDAVTENHPEAHCYLFGTPRDAAITQQLAQGRNSEFIHDLAGKTNLIQFAQKIAACDVVICNDTGGMHLANMLGVPVIAIYGPTNPVRTGPIFDTPKTILQPAGCPETGGLPIKKVTPEKVLRALEAYTAK